jgi:hypothetical protein
MKTLLGDTSVFNRIVKDGQWRAENSKNFSFSPPINNSTPPASTIFLSNSSHSS